MAAHCCFLRCLLCLISIFRVSPCENISKFIYATSNSHAKRFTFTLLICTIVLTHFRLSCVILTEQKQPIKQESGDVDSSGSSSGPVNSPRLDKNDGTLKEEKSELKRKRKKRRNKTSIGRVRSNKSKANVNVEKKANKRSKLKFVLAVTMVLVVLTRKTMRTALLTPYPIQRRLPCQ
jgi:hypothetical protein